MSNVVANRSTSSHTPSSSHKKSSSSSSSSSSSASKSRTTPLPPLTPLTEEDKVLGLGLDYLIAPHLQSFNYIFEPNGGLAQTVAALPHQMMDADPERKTQSFQFWIQHIDVGKPTKNDDCIDTRLFPSECREMGTSYSGPVTATIQFRYGTGPIQVVTKRIGMLPLMVRSARCHLQHMTSQQLIYAKEEACEMGGYFIVNGIERLIRLLIVPRRNFVTALIRSSYTNRGKEYSPYGCYIRCVRPDQSSQTIALHYLNNGSCNVRVTLRKQEFFIPAVLILKALMPTTDQEIYERIVAGNTGNTFLTDRTELMLRLSQSTMLTEQDDILTYLGQTFRIILRPERSVTDIDVGRQLLQDHFFVHCYHGNKEENARAKFDVLIYMIQKLYALVSGEIKPDNPDALNCQEIMLPGQLFNMILQEKLSDYLTGIKQTIQKDMRMTPQKVDLSKDKYFRTVLDQQKDVGQKLQYFLVTGNLVSGTGLDLQQTSGYTIVAEKLNFYRYISHFRSVHRGQFFTTMKTTEVRKLLPESFGFMCPVHTPDGAPCGLLNHLTSVCKILTHPCPKQYDCKSLIRWMCSIGMVSASIGVLPYYYLPVILDGILVGKVPPELAIRFVQQLRAAKVLKDPERPVPKYLEIFLVQDQKDGMYPSITMATTSSRLMRPVRQLMGGKTKSLVEWIGTQEQIVMEIAMTPDDFRMNETTHQELSPTNMFSVVAGFTPFMDYNQSPRNMYQCQMGKQTMGTPFHAFPYRIDNKVFRLQTPQSPLVRSQTYTKYKIDDYPLGANAVVAVISYTGYDMEDAMILNKQAYERGFAHASVYKYKKIDLSEKRQRGEPIHHRFSNVLPPGSLVKGVKSTNHKGEEILLATPLLEPDGLPRIGQSIKPGEPLYCIINDVTKKPDITMLKETETCIIDDIRILGESDAGDLQKVGIKLRINRNPVIGDKFASRAGQKGVLSTLFPAENMPFTESGMTPDVIINPHAFPSRMTIGMLIESMAGKSGCCHGLFQDGTAFQFSEAPGNRAVDYFGRQLVAAGYNYAGTEPLYSGITGQELRAEIFIGVVYYQRLRHMVNDKHQVRSTGPINSLTRQPIKGRKVHGGIRFGEMERDSLLAHGVSFLLHDRLMNCSDYHQGHVCTLCGSVLSPSPIAVSSGTDKSLSQSAVQCRNCNTSKGVALIAIPYVFMYLVNELAAMNIRVTLDVK